LTDDLSNSVNGKAPKDPASYDNAGHGNNEDGVDSSNKGQGSGPNGGVDESCPEGGVCVDDEIKTGGGGEKK
jgi:hypothetical protein